MKTGQPVTIDFKQPGRTVVLLGGLGSCDSIQFGGTEYAKAIVKELWGMPPALDMEYEKRVQASMREIADAGLAESAHDLSDGGLAVAVAESSFGPAGIGASITLDSEMRPEFLLFHEGPSRILISTSEPDQVAAIARRHQVDAARIGETVAGRIAIRNREVVLIDGGIGRFQKSWEGALEEYVR
jgi:phosphoribosylformylglycinamidine synthase